MKYLEKEKRLLVKLFQQGEKVSAICEEHNIPKSTFYLWISQFKQTITPIGRIITSKDYDSLKRRAEKQESIIMVFKAANCAFNAPLKEKLDATEAFFSILKREELYRKNYRSKNDFKNSINLYMDFYNDKRPHKAIRYKTPTQFEAKYADKQDILTDTK